MNKQTFIIRATALLFVALLMVAGSILIAATQVDAKGQCHQINTTLRSVANLAEFTTEGEIQSGILKGTTKFVGDGTSLTQITGESSRPIEPSTFSYTGDLKITTPKGTLTSRSVGLFESVPFGFGTQFDRVIDGTGLFEGTKGFLFYNFATDETGAAFTSQVSGEICVR